MHVVVIFWGFSMFPFIFVELFCSIIQNEADKCAKRWVHDYLSHQYATTAKLWGDEGHALSPLPLSSFGQYKKELKKYVTYQSAPNMNPLHTALSVLSVKSPPRMRLGKKLISVDTTKAFCRRPLQMSFTSCTPARCCGLQHNTCPTQWSQYTSRTICQLFDSSAHSGLL